MRRNRGGVGRWPASGFTLIELMVTVAVLAIVASIAAPSMQALIGANRLSTATTELVTALQLARSEAVRRNAAVTVCASDDGLVCASKTSWTRWIVVGRDNVAGANDVVRDSAVNAKVQVSGPAGGIRFRPSGLIDAQEVMSVCIPVTNPANNTRTVTLMASGGVVTTKANGGGACA
ncbi:GspH/FimT family pseudopilin [Stenotrophomonas pigmentata]|uniref:GspH/FimT family pseudopilin n=1 Tax=Stenotrophomonas pigmentata TaxID=3055080 RepID=UPI0026F2A1AC|nr:GspH/FimT family pseudopilin [Stenotrophomonas sp. 610A2]